ncbi:restriction endonuclease subunit S [Cryobacterium sp. PH31-L1]|uniref:restriction endonuclease subunit S n=1 Tax=Cryobacterium sp. PH31-L1 TaxID=3046199 RepID=UPI0024BAB9C5|nr:restriction endonuclease subunit S [Cryobacterium sp. PH31-L1]MDJ0379146.1 restriction endonuclease subunit S [Cryobacterium sp. PH31-L1]
MSVVRTPVSRLGEFVNGRAFKPDDFTEEGLPVVRIRELLNPSVEPDRFSGSVAPQNLVKDGDLLFAWSATLAVRFWTRGNAILNQHLFNVYPHANVSKAFLRWALEHAIEELAGHMHGSAMTHITREMLKDVSVDLASIQEQQQIAEYLDRETGQIDELITKQEQLVATLTERRQAVITQAVTRGLDPTVGYKDSGIVSVREIPSHWISTLIKHLTVPGHSSVKAGPFGSHLTAADMAESAVKVYNQRSVLSGDPSVGLERVSNSKYAELNTFATGPGDFLITTRGTIGRALQLPANAEEGIIHPCLIRVRLNEKRVVPNLLLRLFNETDLLRNQFVLASNATTIEVIYSSALRECRIALPPDLAEQVAIDDFLKIATKRIDALVTKAKLAVSLLRERRQALISAAVTGKIDVRGL